MNAPPDVHSDTALSGNDVVHWLTNGTRDERFIDNISPNSASGFSARAFRSAGDASCFDPPSAMARRRIMWAEGMREAELARVDYDVTERSEYIGSPASEIHDGITEVRENLERDPSLGRKHAVYDEMRERGLTDYVACRCTIRSASGIS